MNLEAVTEDDLPLYEQIHCDPVMMRHLGGPIERERVPQILRNALAFAEEGRAWLFKVIPSGSREAAGTVCLWESHWNGRAIDEIGWTILPRFQGKGLASEAVRAILEKARVERRFNPIHAFPGTTNAPSNAICAKMGFTLLAQCDVPYAGRILHCNHWRLELPS